MHTTGGKVNKSLAVPQKLRGRTAVGEHTSYFSVAVIRYHDQVSIEKGCWELTIEEGESMNTVTEHDSRQA